VEAEAAELVAAIGNPDTGSPSPAWEAFEDSFDSDDEAGIRVSAETVLDHLRAACAAVAPFLDIAEAGPWATDVRGLLDGLAAAVGTLRDAAIRRDSAGIEAGRARFQSVLLDHFYQSFKMSDPEAWRVQLPSRGWTATASHVRWLEGEVWAAFDGKADTTWLAGEVTAPQWLEVDFGAELTVAGIRLLTYQERDGATDHRVTVRTASGTETELVLFTGDTRDEQSLSFTAPTPVGQARIVRVTTVATPSTIGWREVAIDLAQGAAASPRDSGPAARELATSQVPLNGLRGAVDPAGSVISAGVRTGETNLGDLTADAMLWRARRQAAALGVDSPQVALQNGGGIRNDSVIPAGSITELDAVEILAFADVLVVKEDIPADVFKSILETSVSEFGHGRFGQWSGVIFSADPAAPGRVIDPNTCAVSVPGSRVLDAWVGGIQIFDGGGFVGPAGWTIDLATNDFLMRGGDCYDFGPGDFTTVGVTDQQALTQYLVTATADGGLGGTISAADYPVGGKGRIILLP
jgi:hypothetical protein